MIRRPLARNAFARTASVRTHPARIALAGLLCLAAAAPAAAAEPTDAARYFNPATLPAPNGYSHAVSVAPGRTVYVSGQIGTDARGELAGAGFEAQAAQMFANLDAALKAAGASFADVVKLTFYVTDMRQIPAVRAARDKYLVAGQAPASTAVEVTGFVKPGALVEVDAIAVVR